MRAQEEAELEDEKFTADPFVPFHDNQPPSGSILTFRALLVGSLCGALVNASNIYLGLKAGWTASANIFGSIIGFAVLRRWSKSSWSGGEFGPHENNIVQTAATAAGGISNVFIAAIPALYQLGLLKTPAKDFLRLVTLTAIGGYFGLLSIAPLRKFFLVQVARELDLVFPSSSATAVTIRSMHQAARGASMAQRRLRVMDWHPFTWMVTSGVFVNFALSLESWGWFIEWTPAFIGSARDTGYSGQAIKEADAHSRIELACQWRVFWTLVRDLARVLAKWVTSKLRKDYRYTILSENDKDEAKSADVSITAWMWAPGLLVVVVLACPVMKFQYGMSIAETLLALILAFFLSLLAIQATGATDCTPVGTLSKVSQVVLASTSQQTTVQASQRLNLLGGSLTNIGTSQACDLIGDFRVGFLLGTPLRLQYATQMLGTLLATFLSPVIFTMFATAYPCILSTEIKPSERCEFSLPSASAWRAVAVAATEPVLPIPPSSLTFAIGMSIIGSVMVLIRHCLWTGKWAKMRAYHPNLMILAMAFTLPSNQYGLAMLTGSVIAAIWKRKAPQKFEMYGYAVAAGFMAGEGIGGTINAILSVVGLGGNTLGSTIGCPAGRC
ncbi:hypothetical protein PRK78_002642 [Emydomyces testavorans]|uniref:Oligopeptide transporter n=1 Tax=Emydomyces testavorans TaxID=2070801 RepID=A0AAF0DEQ7_9EURO|nr:hypothetical protein PRK78_002642 [Emydomyces testavorans]